MNLKFEIVYNTKSVTPTNYKQKLDNINPRLIKVWIITLNAKMPIYTCGENNKAAF